MANITRKEIAEGIAAERAKFEASCNKCFWVRRKILTSFLYSQHLRGKLESERVAAIRKKNSEKILGKVLQESME